MGYRTGESGSYKKKRFDALFFSKKNSTSETNWSGATLYTSMQSVVRWSISKKFCVRLYR